MIARVDPDVDICYCEAKHVQSFYASLARSCSGDFDEGYEGRVLILDEVDALIIDEEPNEAFVYENEELGEIATTVAGILARGLPTVHVHIGGVWLASGLMGVEQRVAQLCVAGKHQLA